MIAPLKESDNNDDDDDNNNNNNNNYNYNYYYYYYYYYNHELGRIKVMWPFIQINEHLKATLILDLKSWMLNFK